LDAPFGQQYLTPLKIRISLSPTVPPSAVSGNGGAYPKGGSTGLTFMTDDAKGNLLRVSVGREGRIAGEHTLEIVTAKQAAEYVQSRISLYLAEKR